MSQNELEITKQNLHELFEYKDGELYAKVINTKRKKGTVGWVNPSGYKVTGIKSKIYLNHRLIFMMHYGYMPKIIDHKDGNKLNNCIDNLREATSSQNQHNRKLNKNNSTGVKGVVWYENRNSFKVRCSVNGKSHHIGYFKELKNAEQAIKLFRAQHHKEFANHVAI